MLGQLQAPGHGLGERARRVADPDAPIEIPEETSEKEEAPPPPEEEEEEEPEPATPPAPPPA